MDVAAQCYPPAAAVGMPAALAGDVLAWSTPGLPLVLPVWAFSTASAAEIAAQTKLFALDRRVSLLLAAERRNEAFALATYVQRPLGDQGRLALELATWAAREQMRLGLPAGTRAVLIVGEDRRGAVAAEIQGVVNAMREVVPLAWPRWVGPLVVWRDDVERGIGAGVVIRPALPLLQIASGSLRAEASVRLVRLALGLSAPPAAGWPRWLETGLIALVQRRAAGELQVATAWRLQRQEAGRDRLESLLDGVLEPEPVLCEAVVGGLTAPERRGAFLVLLDLLRHGSAARGALRIAYGMDLGEL